MTRTLREIHWRLKSIANRKNIESRFQASIHNIDLKGTSTEENSDVTLKPEQISAIEKAKIEALERIRQRHGGR